MRSNLIVGIVLMSMAGSAFAGDPDSSLAILESLNWLAGDWTGELAGNRFECHYTTPEGGAILSTSKEFGEDGSCFIEFEKFEPVNGAVTLTPYPGGEKSVGFILSDYDPLVKKARFVNPDHDFPTEITYALDGADKMIITVAGPGKQGAREFKINLSRIVK